MPSVKPISQENLEDYINIATSAFPGMGIDTPEDRQIFLDRLLAIEDDPIRSIYGYFRDNRLLVGMILYDFTMNVHDHLILAGGVGLVVVSLLHKKEKVAKEMLLFLLQHYRKKLVPLITLYPFRPDFYKRMGFGYGAKINQYRIDPAAFPRSGFKANIRYLTLDDSAEVLNCYNRYAASTHGMILGMHRVIDSYFSSADRYVVGYVEDEQVRGYIYFKFETKDDFPLNELVIQEFIYETKEALKQLLNFLHTQLDQVNRIVLNTHDNSIHYLLGDPRNDSNHIIPPVYHETNTQGIGLMYRVLDVGLLFEALKNHNFGGQSCKMLIKLRDTFFPESAGSTIIHFEEGQVYLNRDNYEVAVEMDVSDFSSMVMGVVEFEKLHQFNRAQLSDQDYVDVVTRIFRSDRQPVCLTRF